MSGRCDWQFRSELKLGCALLWEIWLEVEAGGMMVPGSDSGGVALGALPKPPALTPDTPELVNPIVLERPSELPVDPMPDDPESDPLPDSDGEKMFP